MRVFRLRPTGETYTSHAFLVLGDYSRLSDTNTLVDTGRDPAVLDDLRNYPTGVGKTAVAQVLLTHSHYDHVSLIPEIKARYGARILAWNPHLPLVDHVLADGDRIPAGDREFEVIHTTGHTDDSVCFYEPHQELLFAGDTPLVVNSVGGDYDEAFVTVLERLCVLPIRTIYLGHGDPLTTNCRAQLERTLANVVESRRRFRAHNHGGEARVAPAGPPNPPSARDGLTA